MRFDRVSGCGMDDLQCAGGEEGVRYGRKVKGWGATENGCECGSKGLLSSSSLSVSGKEGDC